MALDERELGPQQRKIYRQAAEQIEAGVDASSFSVRFFGPGGELSRVAKSREQRRDMLQSELYRWLKARCAELRMRDATRFDKEIRAASEAANKGKP